MKLITYVSEQDSPSEACLQNIETLARQCLESHPHFHRHYCDCIDIAWVDQRLILSGDLPSFHLKQKLQEALRSLKVQVVNRIEVVSSNGLSSSRRIYAAETIVAPTPRKPR